MSTSFVIDHWWAVIALIGGTVSILIDCFMFLIAWRLYQWLQRRAEPVATFEERLIALEQVSADRARMLEGIMRILQEKGPKH